MSIQYSDRRNATSKPCLIDIDDQRLRVHRDGVVKQALRFDEVCEVRLAIEMAGQDTQIVCRVRGRSGTQIVFGSRYWLGVGNWRNQAVEFRGFLKTLHEALMPFSGQIAFLEGASLGFRWVMTGLGIAMAAIGLSTAITLLRNDNMIGLAVIAPVGIGLWFAWVFRPKPPKAYNPEAYLQ